jgi:hypothetical protein
MPSARDYATIGHLYKAIRTNLATLHRELGAEALFLGDAASQLDIKVIDLAGVEPIGDLAGATKAIDTIVEQGEGSPSDREDSHYREFLAIRRELGDLTADDPSFVPAWPVADSPVLRQPPEPEGKVFIDHPESAALLDFACATYGLLLRCLVQCFGRRGAEGQAARKAMMSAAIDLMHVVGHAATALARLPASRSVADVNAGMTFTMLRGVEPLQPGWAEKRLLTERAQALVSAAGRHGKEIHDSLRPALDKLQGL